MTREDSPAENHWSSIDHPWFSRGYPWTEWALERAVGSARRAQNQQAVGRTLIIGAGTGLDVPVLGEGVTDWILLEPDATMRQILRHRYPTAEILSDRAEAIALPNASCDTVLTSLVLCSVGDMRRTLAEVSRILIPEGQYLFLEHVANPHRGASLIQRGIEPVWRRLGGGCRLTRNVQNAMIESPLALVAWESVRSGGILPIIRGRAVKNAEGHVDARLNKDDRHLEDTRLERKPLPRDGRDD